MLIDDLSITIPPGAIVGIIGPTAPASRPCSR
jgi:ABC-type hemin transport system ATPase subunit